MAPSDTAQASPTYIRTYMACDHPFKAFWTGCYTEKGKKEYEIRFDTPGDFLDVERCKKHVSPSAPMVRIQGKTFLCDPIKLPCGCCIGCRMDKAKEWTHRLVLEARQYPDRCFFVTLTYDEDHARPISKVEIQKFLKRLRNYTGRKFRYFACGEYGETVRSFCYKGKMYGRPHYHLILFGEISLDEKLAKNAFRSLDIEKAWTIKGRLMGLCTVSVANANTMAYVAGYVQKKQVFMALNDFPTKPFIMMSRKPLIGFHACMRVKGEDPRVYGLFSDSEFSAKLPGAFIKKLDGSDWIEDYKAIQQKLMKDNCYLDLAVYGDPDETGIGFAKDRKKEEFLKRKRRML